MRKKRWSSFTPAANSGAEPSSVRRAAAPPFPYRRYLCQLDDRMLLALMPGGHPLAVHEFMSRYDVALILPEAYRILGNRADAEDLCSELRVRLLTMKSEPERDGEGGWPPAHAKRWLLTVLRRLALDMKRSRDAEWQRRSHQREWLRMPPTPYEETRRAEVEGRVEELLSELSRDEGQAIRLLICRDLPAAEACRQAHVSRSTIYRRRDRALSRLRSVRGLRRLLGQGNG
jgi:RNA polymerase sigma factor (sigma-70 family)